MRRLLLLGFVISAPCYAVPVIPNFTQGSSTSRTETSTIITESIRTTEYNSGFFIQLQDQAYSMMDLLLLQQLPQLMKQ